MPKESSAAQYIGGHDSFVFTMKPDMQGFLSTANNDYIMLCQPDYLNIGAQGDGPALHID